MKKIRIAWRVIKKSNNPPVLDRRRNSPNNPKCEDA